MLRPPSRWFDAGPVNSALARLLLRATRISTRAAVAVALSGIVALACLEVGLGPRWGFGLLTYLPIAFAAWRLGLPFGLFASAFGSVLWYALTWLDLSGDAATAPVLWTMLSRIGSFMVLAWMVSEMRDLFERERGLARHCHLTGALTGRAFRDVLDGTVARRRVRPRSLALVYLDLDDFKTVNDARGHAAGDEKLVALGAAIRGELGERDHFARTGGDEFVVLLIGHDGAERAAIERVRAATERALGAEPVPITASMGAVIVPDGMAVAPGDVVRRADAAMYEGKRDGKAGLVVFDLGEGPRLTVAA